jgi:hypothetical protein
MKTKLLWGFEPPNLGANSNILMFCRSIASPRAPLLRSTVPQVRLLWFPNE